MHIRQNILLILPGVRLIADCLPPRRWSSAYWCEERAELRSTATFRKLTFPLLPTAVSVCLSFVLFCFQIKSNDCVWIVMRSCKSPLPRSSIIAWQADVPSGVRKPQFVEELGVTQRAWRDEFLCAQRRSRAFVSCDGKMWRWGHEEMTLSSRDIRRLKVTNGKSDIFFAKLTLGRHYNVLWVKMCIACVYSKHCLCICHSCMGHKSTFGNFTYNSFSSNKVFGPLCLTERSHSWTAANSHH